ncbi:MAG: hypothetical protein M3Z04_23040 [Chloroflexota bacterium]|nr:hypothetical protein [Chloroflexota bacterium]
MANSKPLSNRVPPDPPAAAPASAPQAGDTDGFFAFMARSMAGGNLAVSSGRTQAFKEGWINSVAQGARKSGHLVADQVAGIARKAPRSRSIPLTWLAYLVLVAVGGFVGIQLLLAVATWTDDRLTTLQYGDPRTTHLTATFGFAEETPLHPTLITAITQPGAGYLFVVPGGRVDKAWAWKLPLPFDLDGRQPLHLSAVDEDRDGYLDLNIWSGTNAQAIYLFDSGKQTLRELTPAERTRLGLDTTP